MGCGPGVRLQIGLAAGVVEKLLCLPQACIFSDLILRTAQNTGYSLCSESVLGLTPVWL